MNITNEIEISINILNTITTKLALYKREVRKLSLGLISDKDFENYLTRFFQCEGILRNYYPPTLQERSEAENTLRLIATTNWFNADHSHSTPSQISIRILNNDLNTYPIDINSTKLFVFLSMLNSAELSSLNFQNI